ncbi:MAG: hypothetical protein KKB13_16080 [Chloroflexi bacterium]|nr:hypothetical protein [Chloroflexota bacterium]
MHDQPRQILTEIVAQYGQSVIEDPRRCKALLLDLCAGHRREINVLTAALEERVVADLQTSPPGEPPDLLLARLTRRLADERALTYGAARWAVESWALALGLNVPFQPGKPYLFSSTWRADVLSRPCSDPDAAWEKIGATPGSVMVPSGYELGLRPYGVDGAAFGRWVQELPDPRQVRHLDLRWQGIADEGLAHLRAFDGLTSLDLTGTPVTDTGLIRLRVLTGLTSLSLAYTGITDRRLVHLRTLPHLARLDLRGTRITDRGLVHLRALSLTQLELAGCKQLTDEGLASLCRPGLEIAQ